MPTKAAIYARVSSEKQEEERTIESQLAALREACDRNGVEIAQEYIDDGISGTKLERPGLDRLRDDARRGVFETLYILAPDRLARKYLYQAIVLEELRKKGIEVIFLNKNKALSESPEDQLLVGIEGLIAEYERATLIERVRRGKLYRARSGHIQTSTPLYGYRLIQKTKDAPQRYEVDGREGEVVRLIFATYLRTGSSLGVSKELRRQAIRTRKGGDWWLPSTLTRLLRSEAYAGVDYYNKTANSGGHRPRSEWVPVKVPAIVDREMFDRAQRLLDQRGGRKSWQSYLLSRMVCCAHCGHAYVGNCSNDARRRYYMCCASRSHFPIARTCTAKMVRADRLEQAVLTALKRNLMSPERLIPRLMRVSEARASGSRQTGLESAERIAERQVAIRRKQQRLLDLYVDGAVPRGEYIDRSRRLQEELDDVSRQLAEADRGLPQLTEDLVRRSVGSFCSRVSGNFDGLPHVEFQAVLGEMVDRIVYDWEKRKATIIGHVPLAGGAAKWFPESGSETPAKRNNGMRSRSSRGDLSASRDKRLTFELVAPVEPAQRRDSVPAAA